jgi:hypothetical protein
MPPSSAAGPDTETVNGPRAIDHASDRRDYAQTSAKTQAPETPDLKKHLRAIDAGNHVARFRMEDERFDAIESLCNIAGSHCASAALSSWRRDKDLTGIHLRHARNALVLVLKVFNTLPSDAGGRT